MTTEVETKTEPKVEPKAGGGNPNARLRHYVEIDAEGRATDKCLCGYIWDQLHVPHNGEICQECVDVMRERGR